MTTSSRLPATSRSYPALRLDNDRFFDSDPSVRSVARSLYEETRELPLICPHGHVDPRLLAEDTPFPEPTALLVTPDHYIFRMLYSQGFPLEQLGIPTRDGRRSQVDPRDVWQIFADNYHLFHGTPTRAWLDYELHELFGVRVKLSGDTGQRIYDEIREKLESPEFRPRALFTRFNVERLATTDAATDALEHHQAMRQSRWSGAKHVVPTFRPDALMRIALPGWRSELAKLERLHGAPVANVDDFFVALEQRRANFRSVGATTKD